MTRTVAFRSLLIGAVAAAAVVGAYAIGNVGRSAAATPANQSSGATASAAPTGDDASGGISVSGTGRVTGTPNLLRLQTSVNIVRADVNAALQTANSTMAKVQAKMRADGVAAADLQTSGLSVQPHYTYSNDSSRLDGYEVSEDLSIVLRDLGKAGSMITDVAAVGGNDLRIGGASLDLDEDDALIAQARQAAFADAKAKALAYAKAAGRSLGDVRSISETTYSAPQPFDYKEMPMAAAASAPPVPVQAGSQDVTVTVAVVWSFD